MKFVTFEGMSGKPVAVNAEAVTFVVESELDEGMVLIVFDSQRQVLVKGNLESVLTQLR